MSDTVMVTARVSEKTKLKIDRLCEDNGLKKRWLIEQALIEYYDKHKSKLRLDPSDPLYEEPVKVSLNPQRAKG